MDNECPYFETRIESHVCMASMTSMAPGVAGFDTYCGTEEHYRCPILLARVLREASESPFRRGVARYAK